MSDFSKKRKDNPVLFNEQLEEDIVQELKKPKTYDNYYLEEEEHEDLLLQPQKKLIFAYSGMETNDKKAIVKFVKKFSHDVELEKQNPDKADVLIVSSNEVKRTMKLFKALIQNKPVIEVDWTQKSNTLRMLQDFEEFKIPRYNHSNKLSNIFVKYTFYIAEDYSLLDDISFLIEQCGGVVTNDKKTADYFIRHSNSVIKLGGHQYPIRPEFIYDSVESGKMQQFNAYKNKK